MRVSPILSCLAFLAASPALAGPFAEVGDAQLRQDVELLATSGLIRGPVNSWPLPWPQIQQGLDAAHDGRPISPYVAAAVARLDRLAGHAEQSVAFDAQVSATNQVAIARDFGSTARSKFDSSASVEFNTDVLSVRGGFGYRSGQGGKAYTLEPSQVAVRLGNWAVYGGYTQEWFGPGEDGALLFSNSTRPFPKVGIKRLVPLPIDLPILRWLGPIRLDIFAGALDEKRDYRNTIIIGTRVSFSPAQNFEIGLNRMQQICGQGRPCGLRQITKSFIGAGNADNVAPTNLAGFLAQPGNQIAGFDLTYRHRFGPVAAKFYFEAEAEDSQHIIIEQFARLIGTTLSGPLGTRGATWNATLEYADTFGAQLFNGTPLEKLLSSKKRYPGSIYNNVLYTSGFTYNALPIGYWTDGDSRNLALKASVTDTSNRRWYASVRSVHLNINNVGSPPFGGYDPQGVLGFLISYRVSKNSEKFAIVTTGAELPTRYGDVRLEARVQTDSPNTPGYRDLQAAIEVSLRQRF